MTDDRGELARVAPFVVGAVVVALVAGGVTGALPLSDDPDGETVVERVEQRYERAETVVGNATVTVANDAFSYTRSVSFAAADPDRVRVEFSRNGSEYVAATNGTVAWVYNASGDAVRVRNATDDHAVARSIPYADVSRAIGENASARLLRTTTLGGQETYVVAVEPENESRAGNATLWVDADGYRVHKVRATRGANRTTVAFDAVRFNVSVHESAFRPPDESDATAVGRETYESFAAAESATEVGLGRLDASGYTFESATVVTRAGQTVALQRYAGTANVTLAATRGSLPYGTATANQTSGNATTESVTVAGENATYVELDGRAAVVWRDDGVTRAVVADIDREALVALAEQVRW